MGSVQPGASLVKRCLSLPRYACTGVCLDSLQATTATVAGADWLRGYVNRLDLDLRATVVTASTASVHFRFGDCRNTLAERHYAIPVSLGGMMRRQGTYVIPGDLPLLLSRPALKTARARDDLEDDTIEFSASHRQCYGPSDAECASALPC